MSRMFSTDGTWEERVSRIEKYLEDLSLHKDSRRGPEGAKGESIVGPRGEPGKDVDIAEVYKVIKRMLERETDSLHSFLTPGTLDMLMDHRLKLAGVIDENGKAILLPGPAGTPGADSTVAGPVGPKGDTVVGPTGADGAPGASIVGPPGRGGESIVGPAGPKGDRGDSIIGPAGKDGVEGAPGISPSITSPEFRKAVSDLVLDMAQRGAFQRHAMHITPQSAPGVTKEDIAAVVLDLAKRGSIPNHGLHAQQSQQFVQPVQPAQIDLEAHAEAIVQKLLEKQQAPKRGIVASLLSRLFFGS